MRMKSEIKDFSISAVLQELLEEERRPSQYALSLSSAVQTFIDKHRDLISENKKVCRNVTSTFLSRHHNGNHLIVPEIFIRSLSAQGYEISEFDPIPHTRTLKKIKEGAIVKVISGKWVGRVGRVASIKIEHRIVPLIEVAFAGKLSIKKGFREYQLELVK